MTDRQLAENKTAARISTLSVDWSLYQRYLDEADLSENEKRAFLEALWDIIVGFVDLGFRLDPVQTACGQVAASATPAPAEGRDLVDLKDSISRQEFTNAADGQALSPTERSHK